MKLNQIADKTGASKSRKRIGRGIGSGKGKTSGRGQKGQKSRSGFSLLGFEGGQMPLYRRLPKRGFRNYFSKFYGEVNLGRLQAAVDAGKFNSNEIITSAEIVEAGLTRKTQAGVKLLAKGVLASSLKLEVQAASQKAISIIEKAGGTVKIPNLKVIKEGKGKRRDIISAERKEKYAKLMALKE